jgi:hypothetical protein
MWLYTKYGFYSVVQHDRKEDHVVIRAREKRHLDDLVLCFPLAFSGCKVVETPDADYSCRMVARKTDWAHAAALLARNVDYPNFKASIKNKPYHEMLMRIWGLTKDWLR